MLTDKLHHDGSPLSRCRTDDVRMSPVGDAIEDKVIMSDVSSCSSNKTLTRTPIKMLIAHEMSKEPDSKNNSRSLVAKLMGLDALPREEPGNNWQKDYEMEMQIPPELQHCLEQSEYKDVYEVFNQSHLDNNTIIISPEKENPIEKKLALVREKFMEAKLLATNEKRPQSKRFQDALEVLSNNRDFFVKFLQEPKHQFEYPSVHPPDTKRITVLKPSKLVENIKLFGSQKKEKQTTRASDTGQKMGWDKSNIGISPPNWRLVDDPTQSTRIVVLKPSNAKVQDIKSVSSPPLSPRVSEDDVEKSKEANQHRRDDSLLSSVFSNGYIGDESSFHKSENGYVCNLSDSEVVSPVSRHSWDYIHRGESPFSTSSFGRVSCSPESSVCREAKRRLSERWSTVAYNGNCVEQPKHVRRSSSTLGEILFEEGTSKEQEARGSTSCLPSDLKKDQNVEKLYTNLSRSNSVPVSSTMFENALNVQVKDTPKEIEKSRSLKTSLKGKVTSFFSRGKRSGKGKGCDSQSNDGIDRTCESASYSATRGANGALSTEGFSSSIKTSLPYSDGVEANHRIIFPEAGLSVANPIWLGNPKDNQDQPSPISVLEQLFEEEDNITSVQSNAKLSDNNGMLKGARLIGPPLRSHLIDKSPPIGSISRTISRDNSCLDKRSDYVLSPPSLPCRTDEGGYEWHFYVQSLLSEAGLGGDAQPGSYTARWHSSDSPLDPSLRDQYIDLNEKEIIHEGKRRRIRSTRKLVFDCVNSVLGDMSGNEVKDGDHERILGVEMVNRVWARMREWFEVEVRCDDGDINSLVVDMGVRNEVVGKIWSKHMKMEMDNIGKEIEEKLLEELMHEAVVELTGRL